MSRWFRMYDDLLDDPKVQRLEPVLFKAWVNLLCLASRNGGKIPLIEDAAFALRMSEVDAKSTVDALVSKGLIDVMEDESTPHNWNKRQFLSDNSTERSRKHRGAKTATAAQQDCNVASTVAATPPETETETETETEAEREKPRAQDPKHWKEVQGYLADHAKSLTDWEVDFLHSVKWSESLTKAQATSLKAISDKLKATEPIGSSVFVVKNGTPEFAAWISYKRGQGLKTGFMESQCEITVPSLSPPSSEARAA